MMPEPRSRRNPGKKPAAAPRPTPGRPASETWEQEATCVLLGTKEMLIQMGYAKDSHIVLTIDNTLRKRTVK